MFIFGDILSETELAGTVLINSTIPSEQVDGSRGDIIQHVVSTNADHTFLQLGRGHGNSIIGIRRGGKGEEVGEEAANVGGGHRGSGDGVGGILASDPGGQDVETGGEDVDAGTVVGKVGAGVSKGGCTDGHCFL